MARSGENNAVLRTLPGDDVRQIMWRFSERFDLQMLVQSTRAVARGPVARLVAAGGRNSHEWTPEKNELLKHYDESGITSAFMDPEDGGYIEGPKNLALSLMAFELSWVDAGASTGSLAGNLALEPIHERGTPEQRHKYMGGSVAPKPGESRKILRGSFVLTEPIPFVGVDTGVLNGTVRVAEWKDGQEPILQVDKRGRFITNMGYANFVTAAVDTADPRIKSSCMIILEEGDPGTWDRGTPTKKMVHQLSSTSDPVFSLRVPAHRIIGGYTIKDGVIVPNFSHGEIIEAVFSHTRVSVGLMTSAKLLSAIEPIVRYHRSRFRGGEGVAPGSPRYDLGIQQKEDALHRLIDIWAVGEASSSLGFEGARVFDVLDPLEKVKDRLFEEQGVEGGRAQMRALMKLSKDACELIAIEGQPEAKRDAKRYGELKANKLVAFIIVDALANVLCPAVKLWGTGVGANMMREAVSLMGGYGITEDCPGFLGQKWMDTQLEATYEGPEVVQRRQLSVTMTNEVFLAQYRAWMAEMRTLSKAQPAMGSCALASAMELWLTTLEHLQRAKDAAGAKLYQSARHGVSFAMADALCWLLAARSLIADVLELEAKGPENPTVAEGFDGLMQFYKDLCAVLAARAAGEVGRMTAELVYGYNSGSTCCSEPAELASYEELRRKVDRGLAGSRLAKDRAADAASKVMIPEALDYPA